VARRVKKGKRQRPTTLETAYKNLPTAPSERPNGERKKSNETLKDTRDQLTYSLEGEKDLLGSNWFRRKLKKKRCDEKRSKKKKKNKKWDAD